MKSYVQTVFDLPQQAAERLEALIEADEIRQQVRAEEALYAIQHVLAPQQWVGESEPEWVRRARAFQLPGKVIA